MYHRQECRALTPRRAGFWIGMIGGVISVLLAVMFILLWVSFGGGPVMVGGTTDGGSGGGSASAGGVVFLLYIISYFDIMKLMIVGFSGIVSSDIFLYIGLIFLIFGALGIAGAVVGRKRGFGGILCLIAAFGLVISFPLFISFLLAGALILFDSGVKKTQKQPAVAPRPSPQRPAKRARPPVEKKKEEPKGEEKEEVEESESASEEEPEESSPEEVSEETAESEEAEAESQ